MAAPVGAPLVEHAIDTLPINIAILDSDGKIVRTNGSWVTFGLENDVEESPEMLGVNHLDGCDRSVDDHAQAAGDGIRAVLAADWSPDTAEPSRSVTTRPAAPSLE